MVYALTVFLTDILLAAIGVFAFWTVAIRFGRGEDLDPNFFLVRWLRKARRPETGEILPKAAERKQIDGVAHIKRGPEYIAAELEQLRSAVEELRNSVAVKSEEKRPASMNFWQQGQLERTALRQEHRKTVAELLDGLPAKKRTILRALVYEQLDRKEMCHRFGVSNEYLGVLLSHAKEEFAALCKAKGLDRAPLYREDPWALIEHQKKSHLASLEDSWATVTHQQKSLPN